MCIYCSAALYGANLVSTMFYLFFNDTATTEIYTYCHTLSLHDALPILLIYVMVRFRAGKNPVPSRTSHNTLVEVARSEEHTSELQSLMRISYAVFCLKKKKNTETQYIYYKHI